MFNFGHFLPTNFCKHYANSLTCSEILALNELQKDATILVSHNFYTYDTPPKGKCFKHVDNFKSNIPPEETS